MANRFDADACPMHDDRYDQYLATWTTRAQQDLAGARRAALRWATIALAVLPLLILVSVSITAGGLVAGIAIAAAGGGVVGVMIAFVLGCGGALATWEMVRSITFRIPAPDGLQVTRGEQPGLWARIDAIVERIGADAPDVLVLERGFAAYAAWHAPRPLARSSTWVGIGLATIALFEEDELDAVLAHELAHIHHQDGAALRRTRRALVTWDRLEYRLGFRLWRAAQPKATLRDRFAGWLLRITLVPIGRRIVRRLSAIERAVARAHELHADRVSAEATSPQAAARALLRAEARLPEWGMRSSGRFNAALCDGGVPDASLPIETARLAADGIEQGRARLYLAQALMLPDDPHDEHPQLARRLEQLGVAIDTPAAHSITLDDATAWAAAPTSGRLWHSAFGSVESARSLTKIGELWRVEQGATWREVADEAAKHDAARRRDLERSRTEQLTAGEYLQLSYWARMHDDVKQSRELLTRTVERDPGHAYAQLGVGRMLLGRGDVDGLTHLQIAGELGPELQPDALLAEASWHRSSGDGVRAAEIMERRDQVMTEQSATEQTLVELLNEADPTSTSPTERETTILQQVFRDVPELVSVWVARLDSVLPPLGRPPIAVMVMLQPGTSDERVTEIQETADGALNDAWFASAFDQWFTMYNAGPCPPTTLGGRIERTPHCRVAGLGVHDDELERIMHDVRGMRQAITTFMTKERSLLGRRAS